MSEYTVVYLRNKNTPLLKYREYPEWEEIKDLSTEQKEKLHLEREEHNKNYQKSLGCELFYLTTTPSRELNVLPWSPNPKSLTKELVDEIISFYNTEIENCKNNIVEHKDYLTRLEARIIKANIELYDKINDDIYECNDSINFWTKELEHYQHLFNKFDFLRGIMEEDSNMEDHELIYVKC